MFGPSVDQLLDAAGKHLDARRFADAESSVNVALMMDPKNLRAICFKAIIAAETDRPAVALPLVEKALKLAPQAPAVLNNAACVFARCGQEHRAITMWQRLTALVPNAPEAFYNIGVSQMKVGEGDAAEGNFRKALALAPDHPYVHMNLADVLKNSGRIEEAMDLLREGIARRPTDMMRRSGFLYGLHFDPRVSAAEIREHCAAWGRDFEAAITAYASHENDRDPERPLRVGFVSPNLRDHSETYFILPLFRGIRAAKAGARCETWVYCCNKQDDGVTPLIRELADQWFDVGTLTEEQLAAKIREDGIDVLVDLTMHMDGARLGVFARKPAPVQVTWLAYPSTTGMTRIDATILDEWIEPGAPEPRPLYTERALRLPRPFSYWCYEVYGPKPDVTPPPAEKNGFVTFGSLNHYGKVTRETLGAWAEILKRVEGSRLLLHVGGKKSGESARAFLAELGVKRERVEIQLRVPREEYMRSYQRIDIALDPFPYNGATTTCDALWMGVPVVSRCGETAVSRAGLSILTAVGLQNLVTESWDAYVGAAEALARDAAKRAVLRSSLRETLEKSAVMDAEGFAGAMAGAWRGLWKEWCVGTGKG